jgi:probable rRNA maturation factor
MNQVEVNAEEVPLPPWAETSGRFARKVLEELGRDGWDLSIFYCGDQFIKNLNSRYRNLDEATDILSFSQEGEAAPAMTDPGQAAGPGGDGAAFLAGDIVISLETLAKNAEYFNVSPDEELRRLLIHGILHLTGMDHRTNEKTEPMLRLQEKILANLAEDRIIP